MKKIIKLVLAFFIITIILFTFIGCTTTQGLKGDKGDKGDTGLQGIQGIQGEHGFKGDTGLQGLRGEQGLLSNNLIVAMGYVWFDNDVNPKLEKQYNIESITKYESGYQIALKDIKYSSDYIVIVTLVAGNASYYEVTGTNDGDILIRFLLPQYYLDGDYIKENGCKVIYPECFQFIVVKYPN